MNKKFSTLMASMLLAGGLFSTAEAEVFSKAVEGQYYNIYVNSSGNADTSKDVLDSKGAAIANTSASAKSTWWTIEKVEVGNGAVGYKLKNAETNSYFKVTVDGVDYDTFSGTGTSGSSKLCTGTKMGSGKMAC